MLSLERRAFCTLSAATLLGFTQAPLAGTAAAPGAAATTLVLYRSGNSASETCAAALAAQGWQTCALETDLVRHWRRDLASRLGQGWTLAGQLDWDDWFLLRGLAAEQRRLPLAEVAVERNLVHWVLG